MAVRRQQRDLRARFQWIILAGIWRRHHIRIRNIRIRQRIAPDDDRKFNRWIAMATIHRPNNLQIFRSEMSAHFSLCSNCTYPNGVANFAHIAGRIIGWRNRRHKQIHFVYFLAGLCATVFRVVFYDNFRVDFLLVAAGVDVISDFLNRVQFLKFISKLFV